MPQVKGLVHNNVSPANDGPGVHVQAFAPDPVKCLGTKNAGVVLQVGAGGDVDITDWLAVAFYPTADGQVVFNGDGTKVVPIYSGMQNVIVIHPNVTQMVPSVSSVICGM